MSSKAVQSKITLSISILFSFFISLFIFTLSLLMVVQSTLLNLDFMNKEIAKSAYCENSIKEVEETFASYGEVSSFDENFFKTTLEINQVKLDVYHSALQMYSKEDSSKGVDVSQFKANLYGKLTENVKERGTEITPEIDEALQYLAETCTNTYSAYISLPAWVAPILQKVQTPVRIAAFILAALILFLAVFIFLINRWKHRAVRYYIYSVGGSILMLLALPAAVLLSGKIAKVSFNSQSLYYLAVSYMNDILLMFFEFAAGLLVVLLILAVSYYSMKKKLDS